MANQAGAYLWFLCTIKSTLIYSFPSLITRVTVNSLRPRISKKKKKLAIVFVFKFAIRKPFNIPQSRSSLLQLSLKLCIWEKWLKISQQSSCKIVPSQEQKYLGIDAASSPSVPSWSKRGARRVLGLLPSGTEQVTGKGPGDEAGRVVWWKNNFVSDAYQEIYSHADKTTR